MNRATPAIAAAMLAALLAASAPSYAAEPGPEDVVLSIDPAAVMEIVPLAIEAVQIQRRAEEREAAHAAALAKRGIAEVPACGVQRYVPDTGGLLQGLSFDEWGEFYIDQRFVTDEEMKTVKAIEAWIRKWFPSKTAKKRVQRLPSGKAGVPVFRGFEDARYQMHDDLIVRMVNEFNADKAAGSGGTPQQASKIPDITPALVKSHMIEESGGNGPSSKAAWAVDPLQVNVPGDWGEEKKLVGLAKPARRNEGTAEQNVRAAIRYLSRKGFGASARPASERPKGFFDGWPKALQRYNGRRDRTETDRYYSDEYADKVVRRASDPSLFVPIEIKLKAASGQKGSAATYSP